MASQYKVLSRAQLSYDYLHTNSTTHEFLFGALAELLDNARDASATKINIYTVPGKEYRGGYLLCFLDDGEGMDQAESADIITFGRSTKKTQDSQMIGMYGNGLKSGSMRIGNDFILFTKKGATMTCVFLSRTFHEEEGIDEIVVPMPAFDSQSKKPITRTPKEKEKHRLEMDLILKYSPFNTEALFMKEFDKIEGSTGTLVIIYNQKLLDNGESELDVKYDAHDIILAHPDGNEFDSDDGLMPERKSFRAYASILYVDPRMRIYIQGKKVRTKRLANCLFKPRFYKYSSSRFKNRAELETVKAKEESKLADNRAREAESKARNLESKVGNSKDTRADLRKAQTAALELRKEAQLKKQIADRKLKSLREPKTLNFIFGININDRNQDGMFVYNSSRLIKMYQKVGPQADGGVFCSGVVGVVDVPYLVLEPTHNKQDFADAKEYRHLQRAMGEHVVQYWKDIAIAQQGVTKFWENFGYISPNWRDPPSHDAKFIRKRAMQIQITLQCDLCLKWRILPFSANNIGKTFPDDWVCSMNPDPAHNRCSAPEQKLNIPEGILKKDTKSREQKEKDLAEDIKKKQEQLDKMQKIKPVLSSKQVRELEEEKEEELMREREREHERQEQLTQQRKANSQDRRSSSSRRSSSKPVRGKRPVSKPHVPTDSEPEEDEEEDVEEEEVIEEPPKKRAPVVKVQSKPLPRPRPKLSNRTGVLEKLARGATRRINSKSSQEDEDEDMEVDEEDEIPVKRVKGRQVSDDNRTEDDDSRTRKGHMNSMEITEPDDGSPSEDSDTVIGTKVEVKVQSKWIKGTVIEINHKLQKWKIKLDKHPQDRNDKWYDRKSTDLRVTSSGEQPESTTTNAGASPSVGSQDAANEAPSSSTVASSSGTMGQMTEDIANGYRTCLRYFLPPQWAMDKEAVSTLTIQELAGFPLDDFFDHYEKGLRKLVSSFQLEAQTRQHEAEQMRAKLSSVRKMIAKLLKSINEEFDIDPECDNDQVDELLALCVKQATQQLGEEK